MGTIDDYLAGLAPGDREVVSHAYDVAREVAPDAVQGRSYGMPALILRGKALISIMRAKRHIGVYPFSGRVPALVASAFDDVDFDRGTVRFQPDDVDDDVIRAIVLARLAEIDDPTLRRRPVD